MFGNVLSYKCHCVPWYDLVYYSETPIFGVRVLSQMSADIEKNRR